MQECPLDGVKMVTNFAIYDWPMKSYCIFSSQFFKRLVGVEMSGIKIICSV